MNGRIRFGDECGQARGVIAAREAPVSEPEAGLAMTNGLTAIMVAVGGTSLVCYWLMKRLQNGTARRSSAAGDNSSYSDGSSHDSGGGWNVFNWFSSDSSSSDNSGGSDSSGSSDSGGGDSGGGDGGGGGD